MSEETEHETETPKPEMVPEHPENAGHETYHGADVVAALSERVTALESAVTSMLPENRDETPVKRPWTHKKF